LWDWNKSKLPTWITVTKSGLKITVKVLANPTPSERSFTLAFTSGKEKSTFTIKQEAKPGPSIWIEPSGDWSVGAYGGTKTFTNTYYTSWTWNLEKLPSWIIVKKVEGSKKEVTVKVSANPTSLKRSFTLEFTSGSTKKAKNSITITQAAKPPAGIYIKQREDNTCTLASAAMLLRLRAWMDGKKDWESITETAIKPHAWNSDGLVGSFEYKGYRVATGPDGQGAKFTLSKTKEELKMLLTEHPAGIVAFAYIEENDHYNHAVLMTDYDAATDTFYCADPAGRVGKGRIPFADSYISGDGQEAKIGLLKKYWYIVGEASESSGNSGAWGSSGTKPDMPKNFKAVRDGATSAKLTWSAVTNTPIQCYEVEWSAGSIGWRKEMPESTTATSFVSTGLNNHNTYQYRVRAKGKNGNYSDWATATYTKTETAGTPSSAKPDTPKNFKAARDGATSAKLTWSAVTNTPIQCYEVEWSAGSIGWTKETPESTTATSFVSEGLNNHNTYQYRVRAKGTNGNYSDWATVTYSKPLRPLS
jgi:hypothetical protein